MDYYYQLYNTASAGRLKKLGSIHREGTRIYTEVFNTWPIEKLLYMKYNDQLSGGKKKKNTSMQK